MVGVKARSGPTKVEGFLAARRASDSVFNLRSPALKSSR
jgi:hypothetical protein